MNFETPTKQARWTVLRVEAHRESRVELLSGDWLRLATHFFRGTFLCAEGEDCPACEVLPARCYWYLPCLIRPGSWLGLLELSATASADLEQRTKMAGLRICSGLEVVLSRKTKKAPIRCEPTAIKESPSVARPHEWVSGLFRVFGLSGLEPGETLEHCSGRLRPTITRRAEVRANAFKQSCGGRV